MTNPSSSDLSRLELKQTFQNLKGLSRSSHVSAIIRRELGSSRPTSDDSDTISFREQVVDKIVEVERNILWGQYKETILRKQQEDYSKSSGSGSSSSSSAALTPFDEAQHATKRKILNNWIKQMQQYSTSLQDVYLEIHKVLESLKCLQEAELHN